MRFPTFVSKAAISGFTLAIAALALPALTSAVTLPAASDADFIGATLNPGPLSLNGLIALDGSSEQNSAVDFSISSIPTNVQITGATLNFYVSGYLNGNPDTVAASDYGRTGAFTGVDASTSTTSIGSFSSSGLGIGFSSLTLPPAAVNVLQSLLGSGQDLGVRFDAIHGSGGDSALSSIEQPTGFAESPTLSVTYIVPEPASLGLLGALGCATLIRRKKR